LVIVIGLTGFAGSVFGFRPAMAVVPDLVSMKPNSALAFCFAGLSLSLFTWPTKREKGHLRKLSTGFAGAVAIVGMLTLWEYATGFNLGIDELLFRGHAGNSPTGRMAMITALSFVCLGLALVFLPSPKRTSWTHALTGCVVFISFLEIVGHLYGAVSLYHLGNFSAVAFYTAIAFLTLCAGMLCASSRYGFMQVVTGSGTSGMLVRRYGLAAVVLPILIGWLCLQAERSGWYGPELAVAIFALASAMIFVILIWFHYESPSAKKSWRRKASATPMRSLSCRYSNALRSWLKPTQACGSKCKSMPEPSVPTRRLWTTRLMSFAHSTLRADFSRSTAHVNICGVTFRKNSSGGLSSKWSISTTERKPSRSINPS
jgi:hypothetical protein